MRRRSSFDDDESEQQRSLVSRRAALVGLGVTAVAGGTGLAGYGLYSFGFLNPPPEIDNATGCRLDAKTGHTTMLIGDATDFLTKVHVARYRDTAQTSALSMPDYGLLLVVILNPDDPAAPTEVFRRCAPRNPVRTPSTEGGSIYLRHEWARTFETPLLATADDLANSTTPGARSPLIATMTALTQWPEFDAAVPNRRLVVVSDMLEHDPKPNAYSHLRGGDLIAAFRRSALARTAQADLRGVPVTVAYLQRPEPKYASAQTDAHRAFWRWWFTDAGASEVKFLGVRVVPALELAKPVSRPTKQAGRPRT